MVVSIWTFLSPLRMGTGWSFNKWMIRNNYIHVMNISALNLNLLPVLDALLAERNVSRAGARVGLSQPAVSNALAQLREYFGDPLLVRKGNAWCRPSARSPSRDRCARRLMALEQGLGRRAVFDPAIASATSRS